MKRSEVTKSRENCLANKRKVQTLRAAIVTNLFCTPTSYSPSKDANSKQEEGALAAHRRVSLKPERSFTRSWCWINLPCRRPLITHHSLWSQENAREKKEETQARFDEPPQWKPTSLPTFNHKRCKLKYTSRKRRRIISRRSKNLYHHTPRRHLRVDITWKLNRRRNLKVLNSRRYSRTPSAELFGEDRVPNCR